MPKKPKEKNDIKPKAIKPKRKHIIDAMRFLEATSEINPCQLEQLGIDLSLYDSRINHLIKNKIIIPVSGNEKEEENNYYLDYEFYQKFKEEEDKRFFITIVSIVIPGILLLLLGVAWLIM